MAKRNPNGEDLSNALKYRLSAEDHYVLGTPIRISFTLENLTNEYLWVLTWYTPLEGLMGNIFMVTCDGLNIVYEGPMVKRANPEPIDYQRIGPRESISSIVDLSAGYSLPKSKECVVQFRGHIHDISSGRDLELEAKDRPHALDIKGNEVSFSMQGPQAE
jgi:peptidyl-Lys metalloendopeptidase